MSKLYELVSGLPGVVILAMTSIISLASSSVGAVDELLTVAQVAELL